MVFSCTVVQMDVSWCGHRALKMPMPHCAGVISYLLSFHYLFSAYIILYYLRHWCSGIKQDSHSCNPGSIPGQCRL